MNSNTTDDDPLLAKLLTASRAFVKAHCDIIARLSTDPQYAPAFESNDEDVLDALHDETKKTDEYEQIQERFFSLVRRSVPVELAERDDWEFSGFSWQVGEAAAWAFSSELWVWHLAFLREPARHERLVNQLALGIMEHLALLATEEWIGCFPLDFRFADFPEYTNLSDIGEIVNVSNLPEAERPVALRQILQRSCGVRFPQTPEINNDLDHRLASTLERSLLVIRLGKGEWERNAYLFRNKLAEVLPLLRLCQLAYSLTQKSIYDETRSKTGPARGLHMPEQTAFGINVRTGESVESSDWWSPRAESDNPDEFMDHRFPDFLTSIIHDGPITPRHASRETFHRVHPPVSRFLQVPGPQFEFNQNAFFDAGLFLDTWRDVAAPLIQLKRQAAKTQSRLLEAIERSVKLVASSLYGMGGGVALNAVIGIEAVLTAFDEQSGVKERFARFVAALAADDEVDRRSWYQRANTLYSYRNGYVHRAEVLGTGDRGAKDIAEPALEMYLKCLRAMTEWAMKRIEECGECDKRAFNAFYEVSVFGYSEDPMRQ